MSRSTYLSTSCAIAEIELTAHIESERRWRSCHTYATTSGPALKQESGLCWFYSIWSRNIPIIDRNRLRLVTHARHFPDPRWWCWRDFVHFRDGFRHENPMTAFSRISSKWRSAAPPKAFNQARSWITIIVSEIDAVHCILKPYSNIWFDHDCRLCTPYDSSGAEPKPVFDPPHHSPYFINLAFESASASPLLDWNERLSPRQRRCILRSSRIRPQNRIAKAVEAAGVRGCVVVDGYGETGWGERAATGWLGEVPCSHP